MLLESCSQLHVVEKWFWLLLLWYCVIWCLILYFELDCTTTSIIWMLGFPGLRMMINQGELDSNSFKPYFPLPFESLSWHWLNVQGVCGCDRFKSGSIGDVIKTIVKKDGYRGLLRGWVPRMLFHAPAASICWSTYEAGKSFFQDFNKQKDTGTVT